MSTWTPVEVRLMNLDRDVFGKIRGKIEEGILNRVSHQIRSRTLIRIKGQVVSHVEFQAGATIW